MKRQGMKIPHLQGPASRPMTTPLPNRAPVHPILHLQRTLGNRSVQRLLRSHALQARLKISQPGDVYEQEAERTAEQVMRMPDPGSAKKKEREPIPIMAKAIYGQSCESAPDQGREEEEKEETPVMARACCGELHHANEHLENQLSRTRSEGSALSDAARSFMESRFGHDFSGVRIHTDTHAVQMAKDLNAEAFTTGNHVYFNAGRYNPETQTGKRLLSHELTHVIQQQPMIQRYKLRGFPPAEETAMHAAVPAAAATVKACPKLSMWSQWTLSNAISSKRYDYKEDLGLCGWTFPASWYIEIGKDAFSTSKCCDLASTIAHEASHTELRTEAGARKLECNCFGCSC